MRSDMQAVASWIREWGMIGLVVVLVAGCRQGAMRQDASFTQELSVLLPTDFLTGQKWNIQSARSETVNAVCRMPLPDPDRVPANATTAQVIERVTGRQIVFAQNPAEPNPISEYESDYRKVMENAPPGATVTVGELLMGILTTTAELGSPPDGYGSQRIAWIYIISITDKMIVFLPFPLPNEYSGEKSEALEPEGQ